VPSSKAKALRQVPPEQHQQAGPQQVEGGQQGDLGEGDAAQRELQQDRRDQHRRNQQQCRQAQGLSCREQPGRCRAQAKGRRPPLAPEIGQRQGVKRQKKRPACHQGKQADTQPVCARRQRSRIR
jgi:hypothetical protein